MFEHRKIEEPGLPYKRNSVVDEERHTCLEFVSGIIGECEGDAWKLTWEDRVISFDTPYRMIPDETVADARKSRAVHRINRLGCGYAKWKGVPNYNFKSDQERHQAMLLAIEAFLIFKSRIPGTEAIDGAFRVEYDGKEYRLSDFDVPKT